MSIVTCIAPVNIAVIKYWGKRDEELILPLNDSLSTTLSTDQMRATTSIMRSPNFVKDRLWLNGKEESFESPRLKKCLMEIRKRAKAKGDTPENDWKIHVCSENNFPTAAGLASSAAGYACFGYYNEDGGKPGETTSESDIESGSGCCPVYTLSKLFGVEGDVSAIARLGSGSACRSLDGGFVRWACGSRHDGTDSVAHQLFPASHWPSLRILILVVSDHKKKVSSTSGMQRSVQTSELLHYRANNCVPRRTQEMFVAISARDFKSFAELTMRDSNQFHAVALDTFPPAVYMNDVSHTIADLVHRYNDYCGTTKVAYTFDAGPNAVLYTEETDLPQLAALVKHVFPPVKDSQQDYFTGAAVSSTTVSQELKVQFPPQEPGLLCYCIHTELGSGPSQLSDPGNHLLGDDGMPKNLSS